ncbi:MAG: hypothetical protein WBM35_15005 [Candidatus Electrothrix sp.]
MEDAFLRQALGQAAFISGKRRYQFIDHPEKNTTSIRLIHIKKLNSDLRLRSPGAVDVTLR